MKSWLVVLVCVFAAAAAGAQDQSSVFAASKGKMIVASNGARLGAVYRVSADGSPQIFIDGKLVTVPVATVSTANGRLTTSLSKSEVIGLN
jgi:hypothetical protein